MRATRVSSSMVSNYPYKDTEVKPKNPHLVFALGHPMPMDAKSLLARRVVELRTAMKWNQAQLAKKAGVAQSTISRIEGGKGAAADIDTLNQVADALGVGVASMLDGGAGNTEVKENVSPYSNDRPKVPVISLVAAGMFRDIGHLPEPGQGDQWEQPQYKLGSRGWAHVVDGPSMDDGTDRGFPSGWIIFCDPDLAPTPNAYVIAKHTGEQKATFKQLVFDDGKWYLRPLNRQFPIIEIDSPELRVIAVVTEARPPSRKLA